MPRFLLRLLPYILSSFVVIIGITLLPKSALADSATIFVDPQTESHVVPDEFHVSLKITSAPSPFNTAQANVAVTPNLTIESVDLGDCNFAFFKNPTTSDPSFTGGILGGSTNSCTVYTLKLKANAVGTGSITITNPSVIVISNGSSVPADPVYVDNGNYSISAASTPTPTPAVTQAPVIIKAAPTPVSTSHPAPTPKPLIRLPPVNLLPEIDQVLPKDLTSSKSASLPPITQYTLQIQVNDQQNNPVEGAHLYLYSNPQETVTDQNGIGKFLNVSPGTHKLYISFNDKTEERTIQAKGDSPILISSIKLGTLTQGALIRRIIAVIGASMFFGALFYSLLGRRLKRKIRHLFYFRIIQYFRVRYISMLYVKKVSHPLQHTKRSLKRRVHHFYYYKIWHRLKVKLISMRYIKRV